MVIAYPSLTNVEFHQAGQELTRLCEVDLTGSNWQSVRWTGDGLQIQQTRGEVHPKKTPIIEEPELSEVDDHDLETVHRASNHTSSSTTVDFSIVMSPTYQVPVLWFSFSSQIPTTVTALERVYELIVLPASRDGLRQIGVLGGISIANHPKSDVPAFFIHPCRTQEALKTVRPDEDISPLQYLLLWFGVIASAVGLSVPTGAVVAARI